MTLKDWLAQQELSASQFASRIDRTGEAVRRYAAGTRIPDRETMPLIAQETGFAVTANDFFGLSVPAADHAAADSAPAAQPAPGKSIDLAAPSPPPETPLPFPNLTQGTDQTATRAVAA